MTDRVTANQDGSTTPATPAQNKREVLEAIRKARRQVKDNEIRAYGVIVILVSPHEGDDAKLSYIWEGLAIPVTVDILRRAADKVAADYPAPAVDKIDAPPPIPRCSVCNFALPAHQEWCPAEDGLTLDLSEPAQEQAEPAPGTDADLDPDY